MKIHFTYSEDKKEGFDSFVPLTTNSLGDESVDEISGDGVIEKVHSLIIFIEECYRLLKVGGIATFSSPHYASNLAWQSPLNVRGISELSLYFASKEWRKQSKYSEAMLICDFDVVGNFAIEQSCMQRSEDARSFWIQRYNNVAQAVIFTLTKRGLDAVLGENAKGT